MPVVSVSAPVTVNVSASESVPAPDFVTTGSEMPFEVMVCVPTVAVNATPPVLVRTSPTGRVRLEAESVTEAAPAHVIVPESVSVPLIDVEFVFCVQVPVNPEKSTLLNIKPLFDPPNVNPAEVPVAAKVRLCRETPPLEPPENVTVPPTPVGTETS